MAYIDKAFFDTYTTTVIDAAEFTVLAERASDVIDVLTMHKIGGTAGLALLPPAVQTAVKKAAAAQVETLYALGGLDAVTGDSGAVQSATIGKFSYSAGGGSALTIYGMPVVAARDGLPLPYGIAV